MQCKRILCALLASLMILPLAACGNTEEDTDKHGQRRYRCGNR